MLKIVRAFAVLLTLIGAPHLSGCAANQGEVVRPEDPRNPARTRPAVPVSEERAWHESAGEVVFIIIAGALIIGGIVGTAIALSSL